MDVKLRLDWFRYSAPTEYPLDLIVPHELSIDNDTELAPLPHYTKALALYPAGRIDFNEVNAKQGSLVTLGGKDLSDITEAGISPAYLVKYTAQRGWLRASRIDLAIDVKGRVAHPLDVFDAWNTGNIKTHAKSCKAIDARKQRGETKGETVYIGSRTSDTFLRIYDKGAEQNSDELWTRIELELKGQQAKQAQKKMPAVGIAEVTASKLTDFVKVSGVSWWSSMLSCLPAATEIMKGERKQKEASGDKWLMTQALPAVCKAIDSGNMSVIDVIVKALIDASGKGTILSYDD